MEVWKNCGRLKKHLPVGSDSHSTSCPPKLPLLFLYLGRNRVHVFFFLDTLVIPSRVKKFLYTSVLPDYFYNVMDKHLFHVFLPSLHIHVTHTITGVFIVLQPIRCKMKLQKISAKPQHGLVMTWHQTTNWLILPWQIFHFTIFKY